MAHTYLDYNATTPLWPQVIEGVEEAMSIGGNASSIHKYGRKASNLVEEAREKIANLVNAKTSNIIFTSGGTEANNIALHQGNSVNVIASSIEHDSVLNVRPELSLIDVDREGVICLDHLQNLLAKSPKASVVSVMLANNETGTIQPIERVSEIARTQGILVHCDGIQAVGKVDVDWQNLGLHMMSLSAHKLGGPQGVGALVIDDEMDFVPLIKGGGQERYRRAGTENVPGIVGFGIAADMVRNEGARMKHIAQLRDTLEDRLVSILPKIKIYGSAAGRLPNTSCFSMPGVDAEVQLVAFDLDGIMVSAGSACSSGKVTTSHVLSAMGVPDIEASTAIRVSLGWDNDIEDVEVFLSAWQKLFSNTREEYQTRATAA